MDSEMWMAAFFGCMVLGFAGIFSWSILNIEKKVNTLANKFGMHVLNAEDYFKKIDILRGDFESLKHDFNLHNHKYVFEGNILYIKEPNEVL